MSARFFCTGLPRSKSGWLANLLTWGDSICLHDAYLNFDDPFSMLRFTIKRYGQMNIGVSDPANALYWRKLNESFPDANWVVIHRNMDAVMKSCQDILPQVSERDLSAVSHELDILIDQLKPLVIDFDELNFTTCCEIAEHVGVNIGPAPRIKMLLDFNIQIHPPILKRRLEQMKEKMAA